MRTASGSSNSPVQSRILCIAVIALAAPFANSAHTMVVTSRQQEASTNSDGYSFGQDFKVFRGGQENSDPDAKYGDEQHGIFYRLGQDNGGDGQVSILFPDGTPAGLSHLPDGTLVTLTNEKGTKMKFKWNKNKGCWQTYKGGSWKCVESNEKTGTIYDESLDGLDNG